MYACIKQTMGVMVQHKYTFMGAKHVYEHLENWIIWVICQIEKENVEGRKLGETLPPIEGS